MGSDPIYRNLLKAKIHEKGFKTVSEFVKLAEIDKAKMSKFINGWEIPPYETQVRMAKSLKITLKVLRSLL